MKYNLPERVIRDISTFAKKHCKENQKKQRKIGKIKKQDNNTDLSSYFRVDKKKVLCYTKFTKQSISN